MSAVSHAVVGQGFELTERVDVDRGPELRFDEAGGGPGDGLAREGRVGPTRGPA